MLRCSSSWTRGICVVCTVMTAFMLYKELCRCAAVTPSMRGVTTETHCNTLQHIVAVCCSAARPSVTVPVTLPTVTRAYSCLLAYVYVCTYDASPIQTPLIRKYS